MEYFEREIEFEVNDFENVREAISSYFELYNFKKNREEEDCLMFKKNEKFLSSWSFNPLKWYSFITVKLIGTKKIRAGFFLSTTHLINVLKEIEIWNIFIVNFKNYLTNNNNYSENELNKAIKKSKLIGGFFFATILFVGLLAGLLKNFITHFSGYSIPNHFIVPLLIVIYSAYKNNRAKAILKQQQEKDLIK
ncbi:MAG: hypothetical protein H3C56_07505 [Chitinophagaceae bacterium]|nr:hypothetical protein [Chitinophagaceae bacterium]